MLKKMLFMLICLGVLFGGIYAYKTHKSEQLTKSLMGRTAPPVAVTVMKAEYQTWLPEIAAVGSLRADRGVEVTTEVAGLVRQLHFKSGDEVRENQLLVQLNADADVAQLQSLEALAELAQIVYKRDKDLFDKQVVNQSQLDSDMADLKSRRAQVSQQVAVVEKKSIRAPFAGRVGISVVNPGQYLNAGDHIVTLQALDPLHIDFYLPQKALALLSVGQKVTLTTDTFPGRVFEGEINAVNPKVETDSRNVLVEATLSNPKHELTPGMYASVRVQAGASRRQLTVSQTAVTFNPYGETVFVVQEKGKTPDNKPMLAVKQVFVTVGDRRGDQAAILKGVQEGELVVTSGQLKLRNGSPVYINNRVQPGNDPDPQPVDE